MDNYSFISTEDYREEIEDFFPRRNRRDRRRRAYGIRSEDAPRVWSDTVSHL